MFALINSIVITGYRSLTDVAVIIDNNKIHSLVPSHTLDPSMETYDLDGKLLCPGFIDLQLNGCGGLMFNNRPTSDTLAHMQQTNLQSGTTSFLPTFITDTDESIRKALNATETFMSQHENQVLGMHLEGPFTNPLRRGIHPKTKIRRPDETMINWLTTQHPWLKMVTLAPEMNQVHHINKLAKAGIIVSMGHSAATYEQAVSGIQNGITCATHLYNAMSPVANGREPGVVGAAFERHVYAGIIADGHHVHWANVRIAKQQLGEKLYLVTDGTAGSNPPPGMTTFDFCGATIYLRDGSCYDAKGTLGGSALTMNKGIKLLVKNAGIHITEAIRMATLYPARAIQVDHQLGAIAPGLIANLTVMDNQFQIIKTMVNGVWTEDIH